MSEYTVFEPLEYQRAQHHSPKQITHTNHSQLYNTQASPDQDHTILYTFESNLERKSVQSISGNTNGRNAFPATKYLAISKYSS